MKPILISHRGNISGRNYQLENNPDYIKKALVEGYNVEIDVWYIDGQLFLGHDDPTYLIDVQFLMDIRLWCHAKNIDALEYMLNNPAIHCFWHQKDDVTLTSRNYVWTYPSKQTTNKSIAVLPEIGKMNLIGVAGICSDYIEKYK